MAQGQVLYEKQGRVISRRVFFTASTALVEGQGVCYDRDRGTAANVDGSRDQYVELPSRTNNLWFAGVADQDYAAKTGGQWITIYEPGSVCNISIGSDSVAATTPTVMTCTNGAGDQGRFVLGGILPGRGTALCLQTNASGRIEESTVATAAALDAAGTTLTDTAATFTTNGVAAGDVVVIYAGENDGTNTTTIGRYTVSSITSETVLVLSSAASNGGTMNVHYYIQSGDQKCQALLLGGPVGSEESGLMQWVSGVDNTATTPVMQAGGTTAIGSSLTAPPNGDTTSTLADGVYPGMRKAVYMRDTLPTHDWLITVTSGYQRDGTTQLASLELDANGDYAVLSWYQDEWHVDALGNAAQA